MSDNEQTNYEAPKTSPLWTIIGVIWYIGEPGKTIFSKKKGRDQDSDDDFDNLRPVIYKGCFRDDLYHGEGVA